MRKHLKFLAAAAIVSSLVSTVANAEPLEIGVLLPSPIADVGWSHALNEGMLAVKEKYGDEVNINTIENIQDGPDADRIINKMASDGNQFLLLGSFGFMNAGLKLAQRNPDLSIIHASGYKIAPNFSPFTAKYFQGAYLMGMAAAELTKTKQLGVVGAFAIPELISTINGFTLGARSVDPEITVDVVWINSWFDPAKAQDSAKALLAGGADVLFSNAQDTPSVVSIAEEAGAYVFNLNSSMKEYAPTKYLGVVKTDWAPFFISSVDAHLAGTFEGKNEWLGINDGVVVVEDWSPDLSTEMVSRINDAQLEFVSGKRHVYDGPLVDQAGEERVAEGERLDDAGILSMDWQVEGVTTPLPQ